MSPRTKSARVFRAVREEDVYHFAIGMAMDHTGCG
jgi:hypothetical protein